LYLRETGDNKIKVVIRGCGNLEIPEANELVGEMKPTPSINDVRSRTVSEATAKRGELA
jgi:hypothetical protein